ncbi:Probable conserved lipoprotein LpqB [Mycobacteroides abscessus subsp. abscessus]|nr:Probable conserved lipoprotein LpqB [Mycobacteroides abscessus subsp. abscessus]
MFADQRGVDRWTINVRANKLGTLSDIGVFETAQGDVQDPQFTLVKANGEWRIDSLPNGVLLDWGQFQSTYRRYTVYFADPAGRTPSTIPICWPPNSCTNSCPAHVPSLRGRCATT